MLVAIIPPIFIKGAVFSEWLYKALSLLVVSCPCALVVSIPLGFFSGIIGGMGMGGGTILIPALILFAHIDPKIAQSVNLLSSIPMTIFALIIHIKNKNVVFSLVIPIALFGILGAICGSFVANYLSSETLRKVFGVFLLIVGCIEIKKGFCNHKKEKCGK